MPSPFRELNRAINKLSRSEGETRNEEFLAKVQKPWLKAAEDAENALAKANEGQYTEAKLKTERQEARNAAKPEYEIVKVAKYSLMELLNRDKGLMDQGLEIIPAGRVDTVLNNVGFILAFPDLEDGAVGVGINIQTVSDASWYAKKIQQISKQIEHGQLDNLQTTPKYIDNDQLRGKSIPCLDIFIKEAIVPKLAELMVHEKGKLSPASEALKVELLAEIRSQIFIYYNNLKRYVENPSLTQNKEQLDKARDLLEMLEKFHTLF